MTEALPGLAVAVAKETNIMFKKILTYITSALVAVVAIPFIALGALAMFATAAAGVGWLLADAGLDKLTDALG